MIELIVPEAGESIQEVQIGHWLRAEGQWVAKDENLVELETDKASMELPSPAAGLLVKILKADGEMTEPGDVIGQLDETAEAPQEAAPVQEGKLPPPLIITPAAQRLLTQHGLQGRNVKATGPDGQLLKEDVLRYLEEQEGKAAEKPTPETTKQAPATKTAQATATEKPAPAKTPATTQVAGYSQTEEIVPMSLIRRRVAERGVQAQHEAALLTTFNEIDMSAVMDLRKRYREVFQKKHEIKLGFMSFFVKAVVESLKYCPAINAEIRGQQMVYRNHYDIGVAIGGGKALVVPVLRGAERMSFREIEMKIADLGARAASNKIRPEELEGGTFTITNGGVYGSLLSTPIVNPPQSGVLGMHAIQERPVAIEGKVVIRPMMYVALTYDHRIIDGREAVTFLKRIKDIIEDPSRMLLEV